MHDRPVESGISRGRREHDVGLAVGRGHPLADEISRYKRRPVDAKRTFGRRRSGGVKARVAGERELDRGVGESPADAARISVFHGDAQMSCGLFVGGSVIPVITQQAHVDLVEPIAPAEQVEQLLLGQAAFSTMSRPVRTKVMVFR
jgi:hypothetical protein